MTNQISEADLRNALPDVNTDQKLDGIVSGATIHRDKWGIPHITAGNEPDLFFAQGFATAQDRLFQMDYDRLRCLGRSAEHLGERGVAHLYSRLACYPAGQRRRRAAHSTPQMCVLRRYRVILSASTSCQFPALGSLFCLPLSATLDL